MSPELLSVLPNLSIGVVSIGGLVYVVLQFLKALDNRADKHEKAMTEREASLRAVETDVRRFLAEHNRASRKYESHGPRCPPSRRREIVTHPMPLTTLHGC
jgi:hypothetical protein